jgi:hypothetical protein
MANCVSISEWGTISVMVPKGGTLTKVPFLTFSPEEIAQLRGVLRQSTLCCAVTNRMREYLDAPEVIAYLERPNA